MTPLQVAAANAGTEAEALREAAREAMRLENVSSVLYDAATDAINAYGRARDREHEARMLADHDSGAYNAWAAEDASHPA